MKIIRGWSTDPARNPMDPLLEKNWSFFLEFRGGDICDPVSIGGMGGNWFDPPYPKHVMRWFCKWPILPFISWRCKKRQGYAGFKAYGADSEHYLNWMKHEDVYPGSQALCFSLRPFASVKD